MRDFFSLIPRLPSPGCLAAIVAAGAIAGYLIAAGDGFGEGFAIYD
jgi:hypothetical protein